MEGCLSRVEARLRELQNAGQAGKSLNLYAEALHAFCRWCVEEGYLTEDPVARFKPFDASPRIVRRAMTRSELQRLFECCPPQRRPVYQLALTSGLRTGELRALRVGDLDLKRGDLGPQPEVTKNRKQGFQPLPLELRLELADMCNHKEANEPLLQVPTHLSRCFNKDLQRAGILKMTHEGKLDFHSLRTWYITSLWAAGATPKEATDLARHGSLRLTLETYGRSRAERLANLVETVGEPVLEAASKCAHSAHRDFSRETPPIASPSPDGGYRENPVVGATGFEPATS